MKLRGTTPRRWTRLWASLRTTRFWKSGCGIGRDAIQLTDIIISGSYIGIDIIGPSIAWCAGNISKAHENFKFFHLNIKDQLHNPNGTLSTRDCTLPVNDGSVDRIILWSVFTHMFAADIAHYLQEFGRVLKPDGLVYATCFVVDDDIIDTARRTNLTIYGLTFEHLYEQGCFVQDAERPAGAVAYTEEALYKIVRAGGTRTRATDHTRRMVRSFQIALWAGRCCPSKTRCPLNFRRPNCARSAGAVFAG